MPSVLFIEEGEYGGEGKYVKVKKPLSIIGAGRGKTALIGVGLMIEGNKSEGIVQIEELLIKGGEESGLLAWKGMNVIMTDSSVESCQGSGVRAAGADISCEDLQVVSCGLSGVFANGNATITLSGQGTSIQGNVTKGRSNYYGLHAYSGSPHAYSGRSKIQVIAPLTYEEISTNNGGGGNWGVSTIRSRNLVLD